MKIFEENGMIRFQLMDLAKNITLFDFKIEKEVYPFLKEHIIEHLNSFEVE